MNHRQQDDAMQALPDFGSGPSSTPSGPATCSRGSACSRASSSSTRVFVVTKSMPIAREDVGLERVFVVGP